MVVSQQRITYPAMVGRGGYVTQRGRASSWDAECRRQ